MKRRMAAAKKATTTRRRVRRGPSNDPSSEWYSTPQERRTRKQVGITLSAEVIERLDAERAEKGTPIAQIVEDALRDRYGMPPDDRNKKR